MVVLLIRLTLYTIIIFPVHTRLFTYASTDSFPLDHGYLLLLRSLRSCDLVLQGDISLNTRIRGAAQVLLLLLGVLVRTDSVGWLVTRLIDASLLDHRRERVLLISFILLVVFGDWRCDISSKAKPTLRAFIDHTSLIARAAFREFKAEGSLL